MVHIGLHVTRDCLYKAARNGKVSHQVAVVQRFRRLMVYGRSLGNIE